MKTRVELKLSERVSPKIIKEVRSLSEMNTSEKSKIEVWKDNVDDKLLIVKFDSHRGKSGDIAGEIMKSYSLYLESYSDIAVSFGTRFDDFKIKLDEITKEDVIDLVIRFNKTFDSKDWGLMSDCLGEKLELDYMSLRGRPKRKSKSEKYISDRKKGMRGLKTIHKTKNHELSKDGSEIRCECDFEIERYEIEGDDFFHSYGQYNFGVNLIDSNLKIVKIKQVIDRNEGNRKIHGAFK